LILIQKKQIVEIYRMFVLFKQTQYFSVSCPVLSHAQCN
jgi:hypothetical protein